MRRRPALIALACSLGLLVTGQLPATAAVSAVGGSAYGYLLNISLFGGPVNTRGPAPTVTLPAGGSATPVTATAPTGSAVVGPATFFTSGQLNVSTQGTPGPNGSVTTTTTIANVNTSGQEAFTTTNLASSCTASEAAVSGSTTITGGTLEIDSGDDLNGDGDFTDAGEHGPVSVAVPATPAPNTTFTGHIHVNGIVESFRYVFNEQVANPDGSLTVNAGHQFLLGPTAVGDLIIGQSVCGVTAATGSTFTSVSPARVWDSRSGPGPVGRIGPAGTRNVTVTGVGGVPATGVTAVVLNVTAVGPTAGTFVTAWPTGEARPLASNLNIPPGDVRPNLVIVKVGAGGQVSFYNDAGTIDLIADVAGWYGPSGP